jgi:GTP-binding protein
MIPVERIRNVAIIAHIDHGKTTLIDAIFRDAHTFRESARIEERVMDSGDLERERGITIRAKHCTVEWDGYQINIIDTPGHADFSGEVERVLAMVDAVLLLVDANEGPMPQTRYVLMRALRLGLKPIVVINKVDRPHADPHGAVNETFDLAVALGATDEQLDFPVLYGSGLEGWLVLDLERDPHEGMKPLFEAIIRSVPPPRVNRAAPFLMQVRTLAWSDYIGRIGCGRVLQGVHHLGDEFLRLSTRWTDGQAPSGGSPLQADPGIARVPPPERKAGSAPNEKTSRGQTPFSAPAADAISWQVVGSETAHSTHLWVTRGLERTAVEEIAAGDIAWIAGPEDIQIGDTFSAPSAAQALPPLDIEEPTVSMFFLVNSGPLSGREGRAVTLRQIRERLEREVRTNVALRLEDLGRPDGVKVSGRGELHLSVLVEEMRREGMELCVSPPEVITRTDDRGHVLEPWEQLILDVPQADQGGVIGKVAKRKAELLNVHNAGTGMVRMEFRIPTRGLIGYRSEFLTDTHGLGVMSSRFIGYGPWAGDVVSRNRGSMISMDSGDATSYALENLQERGALFVSPMEPIYAGQIIGEHCRPKDLPCNPCKKKHVTNVRSSVKEIATGLDVPLRHTLESAIEWIAADELVEVTPKSIRLRKAVLSAEERKRIWRKMETLAG